MSRNEILFFVMGTFGVGYGLYVFVTQSVQVGVRFGPKKYLTGFGARVMGMIFVVAGSVMFVAGLTYRDASSQGTSLIAGFGALAVIVVANFVAMFFAS